nr:MAG: coat protein [Leviviridae sp.]
MSIRTASIAKSATGISVTGGTATALSVLTSASNSLRTMLSDATNLLDRVVMEFSVKEPSRNNGSPGGMTQSRNKVVVTLPFTKTVNGVLISNPTKVTIEVSCDVEATVAQKLEARLVGAQLLADTDFAGFFNSSSLD